MISVVAARYAKALADVMTAPQFGIDAPQVLRDLRLVEQIIASSPDLRSALLSPAVTPSRKRAVIARIVQPLGVPRAFVNFMYVVIDHRRIQEFSSIVDAYEVILDERLGFVRADVASAHELTEGQRASLETELSRLSGKKAKLRFTTDAALVAGVVARVGSTVYDGSVRGQLERLRTKLGSE